MNWINDIKNYHPDNEQEAKDKGVILDAIEKLEEVLTRKNKIAHITSSAFTVNKSRDKMLMVYHNIYNSWSWIGGHADGEEDLLKVALKELNEETGVANAQPVLTEIFSLDILPVLGHMKRGEYISPHLHLSVTYLIEADEDQVLTVKEDENSGVKWVPLHEVNTWSNEPHMHKLYEKLIRKLKQTKKFF